MPDQDEPHKPMVPEYLCTELTTNLYMGRLTILLQIGQPHRSAEHGELQTWVWHNQTGLSYRHVS